MKVEARRCGSAIDPVIRVLDGSGKLIARSEDDPVLSLDARVAVTFPKEGFYYIEVHDARFSTQAQNFYRLKTGSYEYASELFPLGDGAEKRWMSRSRASRQGGPDRRQIVRRPSSICPVHPALPLPFAVGEYPEIQEPAAGPLQLPVTINGRLSEARRSRQIRIRREPRRRVHLLAAGSELGTSKIMGLITVYDEKGKALGIGGRRSAAGRCRRRAGQQPHQGDPHLEFKVPEGRSSPDCGC